MAIVDIITAMAQLQTDDKHWRILVRAKRRPFRWRLDVHSDEHRCSITGF